MGDAVSNWAQVPVDHLPKPSASNFTRYYDAKMFLPPCRVHVEELVEPRNCIFHCGGNDFPWFGRHRVASFPKVLGNAFATFAERLDYLTEAKELVDLAVRPKPLMVEARIEQ